MLWPRTAACRSGRLQGVGERQQSWAVWEQVACTWRRRAEAVEHSGGGGGGGGVGVAQAAGELENECGGGDGEQGFEGGGVERGRVLQ
jgi:hypothetical protein